MQQAIYTEKILAEVLLKILQTSYVGSKEI